MRPNPQQDRQFFKLVINYAGGNFFPPKLNEAMITNFYFFDLVDD